MAILTTIPIFILIGEEKLSRKGLIFRRILHLFVTFGIAFLALSYFSKIDHLKFSWIFFIFFIIYGIVSWIGNVQNQKTADQLNARIQEINKED